MSNQQLTSLDNDQIARYVYSEKDNANRVTIVGMDNITLEPKIDLGKLEQTLASQKELKIERIEVPQIIHTVETKVEKISVPVPIIQKEIQIVTVEKVILQDRVVEVKVPVIIKDVEYRDIERQVVVSVPETRKPIDILQVIQVVILFGMFIKLFIK